MSSVKPKPPPSSSKIIQVRCRICRLELVKQDYKDHIKNIHPEADQNDIRPHQQSSILNSYTATGREASLCDSYDTGTDNDNVGSELLIHI